MSRIFYNYKTQIREQLFEEPDLDLDPDIRKSMSRGMAELIARLLTEHFEQKKTMPEMKPRLYKMFVEIYSQAEMAAATDLTETRLIGALGEGIGLCYYARRDRGRLLVQPFGVSWEFENLDLLSRWWPPDEAGSKI